MTSTPVDRYYSPSKVRALCRLYPFMFDSRPPVDSELAGLVRSGFGPGTWQEEAACKRADIAQALRWLQERNWVIAYCVRSCLIVGLAQRYVAGYLSSETGEYWYQMRVKRAVDTGIEAMAVYLQGREDEI